VRHILPLAVALAAIYSSATAAVCVDVTWRVRPTQSQLFGVWPRQAFERGENGRARITCKVSVQGALHDCLVDSEDPPSSGFGGAAVALTPQLLMNPATCDGKPVEGEATIPVRFSGLTPHGSTGSRLAQGAQTGSRLSIPASQASSVVVVANVPWLAAPTYAQVVAAYPERARQDRAGGHVALRCDFDGEGRLANCGVLTEAPPGHGFGAAAHALAKDFQAPRTAAHGASSRVSRPQPRPRASWSATWL